MRRHYVKIDVSTTLLQRGLLAWYKGHQVNVTACYHSAVQNPRYKTLARICMLRIPTLNFSKFHCLCGT